MGKSFNRSNSIPHGQAAKEDAGAATTPDTVAAPLASKRGRWRLARAGINAARVVLVIFFIIGFFLSVAPPGRTTFRTLLLIPALISGGVPAPLTLAGDPIRHIQKTISSQSGAVYLDIYEPTSPVPPVPGAREGIVIIPGVGDNRTVPQLIALSESFAHMGVIVEDITTTTLINNAIAAEDSDAVVQAFNYLSRWPGVGSERIGIAGFSGGGTLACLAAADPRIRDRVQFVAMFGSYFNAETVLRAYGRRAITVDGKTVPWYPVQYPEEVLANTMASGMSLNDGQLLVSAFLPGGKPLTPYQTDQMSPSAVAAYHLLAGDQPHNVEANIAALSPQIHSLLATLSPSTMISKIHAPIYLLHSRDDTSLPISESEEAAAALARIHHAYDFVEFGIFQHVLVESNPPLAQVLSDAPPMFRVLSEILQPSA